MLDKVFSHVINFTDDKNVDNHAYIANRSCLSAITKVQDFFKEARQIAKQNQEFLHIPIILTEDISAAFESLPESLINRIIKHCFQCEDFKIDDIVSSYLDRKSYVIDRSDRNHRLKIRKRYHDRSSPQGSVLSPKFWRFFDKVFSHHYKKALKRIVDMSKNISLSLHCCYADDHLTCLLFRFNKNDKPEKICKTISIVAETLRACLDFSTKATGCGINPDKSEIICPPELTKTTNPTIFVPEGKDEFIWLGYSLGIRIRYDSFYLDFTSKKIDNKIASCRKLIRDIFQSI